MGERLIFGGAWRRDLEVSYRYVGQCVAKEVWWRG